MSSPEWNILDRTQKVIRDLAAQRLLVASEGEVVRSVNPIAVRIWKVPEGTTADFRDLILPAILISPMPVETQMGAGLNCADDEAVRLAVQIVDSAPSQNRNLIRTYSDWMDLIRGELLEIPNPFLQDADVDVYDPFVVHILRRVPAEAKRLIVNEQLVGLLVFQVMVRHHR